MASASLSAEPTAEDQTKVSWAFRGHMPYPMDLLLLVMDMDTLVGNDLQQGLDNLKKLLE